MEKDAFNIQVNVGQQCIKAITVVGVRNANLIIGSQTDKVGAVIICSRYYCRLEFRVQYLWQHQVGRSSRKNSIRSCSKASRSRVTERDIVKL